MILLKSSNDERAAHYRQIADAIKREEMRVKYGLNEKIDVEVEYDEPEKMRKILGYKKGEIDNRPLTKIIADNVRAVKEKEGQKKIIIGGSNVRK